MTFLHPEFAMDTLKTLGLLLVAGICLGVALIARDVRDCCGCNRPKR